MTGYIASINEGYFGSRVWSTMFLFLFPYRISQFCLLMSSHAFLVGSPYTTWIMHGYVSQVAFFFWKARPSGPQTLLWTKKRQYTLYQQSHLGLMTKKVRGSILRLKERWTKTSEMSPAKVESIFHHLFYRVAQLRNIMKHFPDCTNRLCWCAKWTIPTHSHFSAPKFMIYSSQGTRRAALHPGCGAMAQCLTGYMSLTFQAKTHLRKLRW